MASESETVMAVCAEWRDCIESADPSVWNDERIAGLVKTTKAQQIAYLARIEAAWKREKSEWEAAACVCVSDAVMSGRVAVEHVPVGNAAAMREALVELTDKVLDYLHKGLIQLPLPLESATAKARAALSASARQCDVGTVEEQTSRLRAICNKYKPSCLGCKHITDLQKENCWLAWAQAPYEAQEGAWK